MSNAGPSLSGASAKKSYGDVRFAKKMRYVKERLFNCGSKNAMNGGNFLNILQVSTPN